MKRSTLLCWMAALLFLSTGTPARAQQILDTARPRLAVAPDGSFAIAMEAFIEDITQQWKVLVQRYAPNGAPVGPINVFSGESCSGLDIWTPDWQENIEMAFRSDGILLVLMQHAGRLSLPGGIDDISSSEATFGAVNAAGQILNISTNPSVCVQKKEIFVGGGRQDRPRMALTPDDAVLLTVDGYFRDSDVRNVAIRVLNAELQEVEGLGAVIPHDDPLSQQRSHSYPDIATNGTLMLSVWQACPTDNNGNWLECDVEVQFAQVSTTGLSALGGNVAVNAGDPAGTFSLFPAAAMNASGAGVVVWADTRTGRNNEGDIFGQRFDANGQKVGDNFQISVGEGEIFYRPEIAVRPDGSFMVVWTDCRPQAACQAGEQSADFKARGRQFAADGTPLGPPFLLSNRTDIQTGRPGIATDGASYFYTYSGRQGGGERQVLSNTAAITPNEAVDVPQPDEGPTLDVYPNPFRDTGIAAYRLTEPGPVRVELYDVLGRVVWQAAEQVQAAGEHQVRIDAASLPAGIYVLRLHHGERVMTRTLVRSQ